MKPCRECGREVSEQAYACPGCGAPYPARERFDGYGFEYRSRTTLLGLPLLHISFKYSPNRMPVPAKGIIAIGQVGAGIVTIAQFGAGVICVTQFGVGIACLSQFTLAFYAVAQIGVSVFRGYGMMLWSLFGN